MVNNDIIILHVAVMVQVYGIPMVFLIQIGKIDGVMVSGGGNQPLATSIGSMGGIEYKILLLHTVNPLITMSFLYYGHLAIPQNYMLYTCRAAFRTFPQMTSLKFEGGYLQRRYDIRAPFL